jgi:hypothetical protein
LASILQQIRKALSRRDATMADAKPLYPSDRARGGESWLADENRRYATTPGVSERNRHAGFVPAYRDAHSGRVVPSRYADGRPAPIHILEGLPADWVIERDLAGKTRRVRDSIVAGFVLDSRFFTREEARDWIQDNHGC